MGLIAEQWDKDPNNLLIVAGFIRRYDVMITVDIQRIIASYYSKEMLKFSANRQAEKEKQQRREDRDMAVFAYGCFCFFSLFVFSYLFLPDIAGLIISQSESCDSNLYLSIGCSIHFVLVIGLFISMMVVGEDGS